MIASQVAALPAFTLVWSLSFMGPSQPLPTRRETTPEIRQFYGAKGGK